MGIQSDTEVTPGNTMNSSTNKPVAIAAGPHPPAGKRRVFLVEAVLANVSHGDQFDGTERQLAGRDLAP